MACLIQTFLAYLLHTSAKFYLIMDLIATDVTYVTHQDACDNIRSWGVRGFSRVEAIRVVYASAEENRVITCVQPPYGVQAVSLFVW